MRIRAFCYWLAIVFGASMVSPPAPASEIAKLLPWLVRYGAILCPSAFQMKEAEAAVRAGDAAWLEKTSCFQQQIEDGVEVVLIDTPLAHSGHISSELLWRVRPYPPGDSDGQGPVYVDPWDVQTYAVPTVPLTSKVAGTPHVHHARPESGDPPSQMRGDTQMTFKTAADAERWFDRNIFEWSKRFIPHRVYAEDGVFKLLMGPASYSALACNDTSPSLSCIGILPSR
jgi:hypothetical protein